MNKGRNLAILMACLLSISLLAFLTRQTDAKRSAVVDDVRYIQEESKDGVQYYAFYFVGDRVMEGHVTQLKDGRQQVVIYERIPPDGEEYECVPYGYTYFVSGTELENGRVTWQYAEGFNADSDLPEEPYERFSQRMFLTMFFGRQPLLSIAQAFIVALVAACGGLVIFFAEELWHLCGRKKPEEDPKWEELTIYKRIGGGVMIVAVILLVVFVII